MLVVKGIEDENHEGGGMDGSRVVKIFELDAAQGFVGLAGLALQCLPRRRRQEKEDGKKEPHQLMASDSVNQAAATARRGEKERQQQQQQQQQAQARYWQ